MAHAESEFSDDDDLSIITLNESDGFCNITHEFTNQLNLHETSCEHEEIRQAHSALSTAYSTLKTKYNRLETEHRDLRKKLVKLPEVSIDMAARSAGNDTMGELSDDLSGYLRHPPEIAAIRRTQSNRNNRGSWQVGDNLMEARDGVQYVPFLEKQLQTSEAGKKNLLSQLFELKLKVSESALVTENLKQERAKTDDAQHKLKSENKALYLRITQLEEENVALKQMNSDLTLKMGKLEREKQEGSNNDALPTNEYHCLKTALIEATSHIRKLKELTVKQANAIQKLHAKMQDASLSGSLSLVSIATPSNYTHSPILSSSPLVTTWPSSKNTERMAHEGSFVGGNSNSPSNFFSSTLQRPHVCSEVDTWTDDDFTTRKPYARAAGDVNQTHLKGRINQPDTNFSCGLPTQATQDDENVWNSETELRHQERTSTVGLTMGRVPLNNGGNDTVKHLSDDRGYRNVNNGVSEKFLSNKSFHEEEFGLHMPQYKPVASNNLSTGPYRVKLPVENETKTSYVDRECPVCEMTYGSFSQEEFETHVIHCMDGLATPTHVDIPDSWVCPLCDFKRLKTDCTEDQFAIHVNDHFNDGTANTLQFELISH